MFLLFRRSKASSLVPWKFFNDDGGKWEWFGEMLNNGGYECMKKIENGEIDEVLGQWSIERVNVREKYKGWK